MHPEQVDTPETALNTGRMVYPTVDAWGALFFFSVSFWVQVDSDR